MGKQNKDRKKPSSEKPTKEDKKVEKPKKSAADEIDDIFNKKKITDTSEIDDIFNKKSVDKKKKKDKESEEEEGEELTEEQANKVQEVVFAELAAVKKTKNPKKRPAPAADGDEFGDSRGIKKTSRYTDDGYPLYDVKDLNIGNGQDTPDCPFDCQCCF